MLLGTSAHTRLEHFARTALPEAVIFGHSGPMELVRQKVKRFAAAKVPILIEGENGTGKQTLAQFIHRESPCQNGPFVEVNCSLIPRTLLESELLGDEQEDFVPSDGFQPGRVARAHHGTLFLDEIAEVDLLLQAKLLKVFRDGEFWRMGPWENQQVDARLICASNRHLEKEVEAGRFRRDLLCRINPVNLRLPPLRERSDDIPDLAEYFLELYNQQYQCKAPLLSTTFLKILKNYDWPGNIRQLENLVRRYVILGSEEAICSELLRGDAGSRNPELPPNRSISLKKMTRDAVQSMERRIILKALEANRWNRKQAAYSLNISYRTLLYKIKEARLPSKRISLAQEAPRIAMRGSANRLLGTNGRR